jgi:hypothetical protein
MRYIRSRTAAGKQFRRHRLGDFSAHKNAERTDSLQRLGFQSLQQYLQSDLWRGIREAVLRRDDGRCHGCGAVADRVMRLHDDYATYAGESLIHLRSCCRHHRATSRPNGTVPRARGISVDILGMAPFSVGRFAYQKMRNIPTSYLRWSLRHMAGLTGPERKVIGRVIGARARNSRPSASQKRKQRRRRRRRKP